MKHCLLILLFGLWMFILPGIEVSGRISVDTIWTMEDSPYIVTSFLYIDAGVLLKIEPGVDVRILGADKSDIYNFQWLGNNQPLAKMIIVYGQIEAMGTKELPISFDVHNENDDYRWGGIYIDRYAPLASFEYCIFKRSFYGHNVPGHWSTAAIYFDNGLLYMRHNTFINNLIAFQTFNLRKDTLVYDCKFYADATSYPLPFNGSGFIGLSAYYMEPPPRNYQVTIAKCYFTGEAEVGGGGYYADNLSLNNIYDHVIVSTDSLMWNRNSSIESGSASSYGNYVLNGRGGYGCHAHYENDTAFSRRNTIIKYPHTFNQFPPIRIGSSGRGKSYVSDNYLEGAVQVNVNSTHRGKSWVYNNIIKTGNNLAMELFMSTNTYPDTEMKLFNNLLVSTNPDTLVFDMLSFAISANVYFFNNTFSSFHHICTNHSSVINFYNNIFHRFQLAPSFGDGAEFPNTYGYNCFTLPISPGSSTVDAGGNIVADPLFVDEAQGDYSLQEASYCIDAGLYLPDLPAFDIRYHRRVAPGAEGASRKVDMGAYEYNSVYIGGIRAFLFDAETAEPLDCVKAQILGKLPEFSDTLGCFHYPCGAGTYRLTLSRWDYQPLILENVVVKEGEDLVLELSMQKETVSIPTDDSIFEIKPLNLSNYPNPFNPQTTISYSLKESGPVSINIYNQKGQLVKTLVNEHKAAGNYNVLWNGKDNTGRAVSSGVYLCRLSCPEGIQTKKMLLLK